MNLKRDNWTNDEVINILWGLQTLDKTGKLSKSDWNTAIDTCVGQFWDFSKPETDHAAMAYDTESKQIFVIGPPLPQ